MSEELEKKIYATIGKNVSEARAALKLTQAKLAERSGVSRSTIAKIETFTASSMSVEALASIAEVLHIPVYMLMLCEVDWKNLEKIADSAKMIDRYMRSEDKISPDEVVRIEEMSKSDFKQERHDAMLKTKTVVGEIRGTEIERWGDLPSDIEQSRAVGIRLAMRKLPSSPILNGLIGSLLSA